MHPWERRLRDLSLLLKNCGDTYFVPDAFRLNLNQFLQTSRTVTFIIQKNKADIPNFDQWYQDTILTPWATDEVMTWAKNARNTVEKIGDLEMHSMLRTSLLFSHIESQDIVLSAPRNELMKANIEKLIHFVKTKMPRGIAESAVLKLERRWVANSLPNHELLNTLTYTYARIFEICSALALHLGTRLDRSIASPTSLDPTSNDTSQTRLIKIGKAGLGRQRTTRFVMDPHFQPPQELNGLLEEFKSGPSPTDLSQTVERFAKFAKGTFEHFGYHIPMLFLFDDQWKLVDSLSAKLDDQSEKFIFWRNVAERAAYQRAYAMVWISELWLRDLPSTKDLSVSELPIIGERLHVIGMDIGDHTNLVEWNIQRNGEFAKPTLEAVGLGREIEIGEVFFAKTALAAMKRVRGQNPD